MRGENILITSDQAITILGSDCELVVGGTLGCTSACEFDISACEYELTECKDEDPDLPIPDNGWASSGADSALTITQVGTVTDINVFVEISHTYIDDLLIFLDWGPYVAENSVQMSAYKCINEDDISVTFDDE